jgi:sugar phosphate permease
MLAARREGPSGGGGLKKARREGPSGGGGLKKARREGPSGGGGLKKARREGPSALQRALFMFSLVVAGEAVFALPFHVTRYFRPTFLAVFGFTNTELGQAMAAYGVVAMIAYFPGGLVADRFTARGLITISLLATAVGGMYMTTFPGVVGMAVLWGFWGATTTFLLWAAMIRATRDWGGSERQGAAFGILDGGRGLFGALLAIVAAQAFAYLMPVDVETASEAARASAMRNVIWLYVAATLGAASLAWIGIPSIRPQLSANRDRGPIWQHVGEVVRMPAIWFQAIVVITAYVAYKATDDFGLFAKEAYGLDEVQAAWISGLSAWIRPIAALAAGWLADRSSASSVTAASFLILMFGFATMAAMPVIPGLVWMLASQIAIACVAVYGLRGVYFALFGQAAIPVVATGTAVGIVSVVGYTPDIFAGLLLGVILDAHPGTSGHQLFFAVVAAIAAVGLLATLGFVRCVAKAA